jgi:hypothetical protein
MPPAVWSAFVTVTSPAEAPVLGIASSVVAPLVPAVSIVVWIVTDTVRGLG